MPLQIRKYSRTGGFQIESSKVICDVSWEYFYLLDRLHNGSYMQERVKTWNICAKTICAGLPVTLIKLQSFKAALKRLILQIQGSFDDIEWFSALNFSLETALSSQFNMK